MKSVFPHLNSVAFDSWLSLFQVHPVKIKSPRSHRNEIVFVTKYIFHWQMLQACTRIKIKDKKFFSWIQLTSKLNRFILAKLENKLKVFRKKWSVLTLFLYYRYVSICCWQSSDGYMDNDWLDSLFEDPVLNDKMITDAVQPPRIHSEHSYSINDNSVPSSPLGLGKLEGTTQKCRHGNQRHN